ncbi:hypothetical protein SAMN04487987_102356 [Algibacter pectinivorans]|uniref:Uncharacterized protein n=1 Tax=Algibacter pectinivorans TaxID=870482 RepID=A0A1I1NKH7_9FLAO|nr:hypothetical protein SAMN04487987_102356 [Algibacter pectinivorans]
MFGKKKKEYKQYDPNWWVREKLITGLILMAIVGACIGLYELIKMLLK